MKKLFNLILIGLFLFSVTSYGSVLEKHNIEFSKNNTVIQTDTGPFIFINAVTFTAKPIIFERYSVKQTKTTHNDFAVVKDVGCNAPLNFSKAIIYHEKLNSDYLIDREKLLNTLGIKQHRISC